MREMGRLGGKRRMATLTPERRRQIARMAALARWASKRSVKTSSSEAGSFANELRWLAQHKDQYLGKWVALEGNRLLASGASAREVYLAARRAGVQVPFVEQVQPLDNLPFGGW